MELADKPGSVVDNHSSGASVTTGFKRPTRIQRGPRHRIPIWSCSERGLPSPQTVTSCAVRSYRTFSPLPTKDCSMAGGILSAALSVGSHPPGVTWRSALWSPDFPRSDRLKDPSAIAWPTPARTILNLLRGNKYFCSGVLTLGKSNALNLPNEATSDKHKRA